jgi:hypothetical protein
MATYIDEDYEKLESDLKTVAEKVHLCREMMAAQLTLEDGLGEVVGFLETCLNDRMSDLIKAGTQGQMSEDLFAKVLSCNDAVQRTLEAEREGKSVDIVDEGLASLIGDVQKTVLDGSNGGGSKEADLLGLEGDSAMTGPAVPMKKKMGSGMGIVAQQQQSRVGESFTIIPPTHSNGTEDPNTFVSPFHSSSSGGTTPLDGSNREEDDFDKFLKEIDKK